MLFHNLDEVFKTFEQVFDINILAGISDEDRRFALRMFHRRHVYEHKGGEADEKYIADSGDTSVRPKQFLRETQETVHRLVSLIVAMSRNLHRGFHEIFPPHEQPIASHAETLKRMNTR
jgi:hypothetical protein